MWQLGAEEDDLDGVGAVDGEEKDDGEHTPLVGADVADILVQVALSHRGRQCRRHGRLPGNHRLPRTTTDLPQTRF